MEVFKIIYEKTIKYFKDKNEFIDKEYFKGILKSVTYGVEDGYSLNYSCNLASQLFHDSSNEGGHLEKSYVRKHAKKIIEGIKNK